MRISRTTEDNRSERLPATLQTYVKLVQQCIKEINSIEDDTGDKMFSCFPIHSLARLNLGDKFKYTPYIKVYLERSSDSAVSLIEEELWDKFQRSVRENSLLSRYLWVESENVAFASERSVEASYLRRDFYARQDPCLTLTISPVSPLNQVMKKIREIKDSFDRKFKRYQKENTSNKDYRENITEFYRFMSYLVYQYEQFCPYYMYLKEYTVTYDGLSVEPTIKSIFDHLYDGQFLGILDYSIMYKLKIRKDHSIALKEWDKS